MSEHAPLPASSPAYAKGYFVDRIRKGERPDYRISSPHPVALPEGAFMKIKTGFLEALRVKRLQT